jgi:hypothetical protein
MSQFLPIGIKIDYKGLVGGPQDFYGIGQISGNRRMVNPQGATDRPASHALYIRHPENTKEFRPVRQDH